jgi:hypothetical protein
MQDEEDEIQRLRKVFDRVHQKSEPSLVRKLISRLRQKPMVGPPTSKKKKDAA